MTYPTIPFLSNTVNVAGTQTKWVVIITPFLVLALVFALSLLIDRTKIGMAMRAVSKDFETSRLMGIKINSVISVTFIIGSALAAIGSILFFTNYPAITPTAGTMPGLKAFVAADGVLLLDFMTTFTDVEPEIWICNVTHDFFGEHPNDIYIKGIE